MRLLISVIQNFDEAQTNTWQSILQMVEKRKIKPYF